MTCYQFTLSAEYVILFFTLLESHNSLQLSKQQRPFLNLGLYPMSKVTKETRSATWFENNKRSDIYDEVVKFCLYIHLEVLI